LCLRLFYALTFFTQHKNIVCSRYAVRYGTCYAIFGEREIIAVSRHAHPPKNHKMIKKRGYLYPLDKMNELRTSRLDMKTCNTFLCSFIDVLNPDCVLLLL